MRTEAQKAADKRYKERNKGADVQWVTRLKPDEAQDLDALLKEKGLNRAQFLRWAMQELKNQ